MAGNLRSVSTGSGGSSGGGTGNPGGTGTQVQYRVDAITFGGIAGSVVGTGLSAGSVTFARLSVGSPTVLSGISDTYGFIDGGFIVREHGINAQSLNLGSGGTSGTYSIGNLSGQGTGGFLSFSTGGSTLTGGNGDLNILTNSGGQVFLSGSDGSVLITNQSSSAFVTVDAVGGATLRSQGDGGGIYADAADNTYVGWFSNGFHMTVANDGSVSWGDSAAPSQILRVGPDYGTGGYWVFNAQNTGGQAFFDIISGNNGVSCSIRVFSDVQCGEFAAVGTSGEYFSNTINGDTALKGDPGGGNNFRIGVGSAAAQFNVGNTAVTLLGAKLITQASTTSLASLNLPSGTAPSSPVNGDMWYDGTHLYAELAGVVTQLDSPLKVQPASESSDNTCFPAFFNSASGTAQQLKYNSGFGYNAATNALTATSFNGVLNGTATLNASTTALASMRMTGGTAPTSPNDGDIWYDSTQKTIVDFLDGIKAARTRVIFTGSTAQTVTNTTTETTAIPTGVGTKTLPANFWVAGKTIRIEGGGVYSTAVAPGNLVVKVKYGSTVLATVTISALLSTAVTQAFEFQTDIVCVTTGATGTVYTDGHLDYSINAATGQRNYADMNNGGATTTIDTTTANVLDVTVTWATASTSNIIKTIAATYEVLN